MKEIREGDYTFAQKKLALSALHYYSPPSVLVKRDGEINTIIAAFHRMSDSELEWLRSALFRNAVEDRARILLNMLNDWERRRSMNLRHYAKNDGGK